MVTMNTLTMLKVFDDPESWSELENMFDDAKEFYKNQVTKDMLTYQRGCDLVSANEFSCAEAFVQGKLSLEEVEDVLEGPLCDGVDEFLTNFGYRDDEPLLDALNDLSFELDNFAAVYEERPALNYPYHLHKKHFYVALFDDDELLGLVDAEKCADHVFVHYTEVFGDRRGKGYGTKLSRNLLEYVEKLGVNEVRFVNHGGLARYKSYVSAMRGTSWSFYDMWGGRVSDDVPYCVVDCLKLH